MDYADLVLLTTQQLPEAHEDDLLLARCLEQQGLRVRLENWEDFHPNPELAAGVLFRTTWGYYKELSKFKRLLKEFQKTSLMVWNPIETIRWNLHKKYLLELRKRGLPVVPTKVIEPDQMWSFYQVTQSFECESLVVKPAIHAGGYDAYHIEAGETFEQFIKEMDRFRGQSLLVQPFLPAVIEEGELSLIFIDGEFSHCILKRPRDGEFRVQPQHGGYAELIPCPDAALAAAYKILNELSHEHLYARVDLVRVGKAKYLLMELELIEPNLWLTREPSAATRLAQSLSKQL